MLVCASPNYGLNAFTLTASICAATQYYCWRCVASTCISMLIYCGHRSLYPNTLMASETVLVCTGRCTTATWIACFLDSLDGTSSSKPRAIWTQSPICVRHLLIPAHCCFCIPSKPQTVWSSGTNLHDFHYSFFLLSQTCCHPNGVKPFTDKPWHSAQDASDLDRSWSTHGTLISHRRCFILSTTESIYVLFLVRLSCIWYGC